MHKNNPNILRTGVGSLLLSSLKIGWFITAACLLQGCMKSTHPNILILFLDDFGYNDLGANHSPAYGIEPLSTPNMNAFAAQSSRFSRHYTESTCSPSRAALLSGRYPARAGFTSNGRGLSPEIITLPERLVAANYRTHFTGKWHTGDTTPLAFPQNQGFDTWFGFLNQWMLREEYSITKHNLRRPTYENPWLEDESGIKRQYSGHLNDLISNNAKVFITEASADATPWFLQVSFYAPHEPVQAAERFRRLYPDTPEGAYRAIVQQLDENIGSILGTLNDEGLVDNTIVVIVSDNGGTSQRFPSNLPFDGIKANYKEGGIRTPLMVRWLDKSLNQQNYPYAVSIMDLYPTLLSAANVYYDETTLDGRNLLPFLKENIAIERPLFWEILSGEEYLFSVLSEDQRWRYSTGFLDGEWLFDLEMDPYGFENVLPDNPIVANNLKNQYLQWHELIHRIETTFEEIDQYGKGILTGDSFQRSPGFGGFTFAIGITVDAASAIDKRSIIASQSQLLSIYLENGMLEINLQDVSLQAVLPTDGQCHSLIVTAIHNGRISVILGPQPMNSPIDIIVDGKLQASLVDHREMPKSADLTAPTYIGFRPGASSLDFEGRLSPPLLYNHQVSVEPQQGQFGIDQLLRATCPDD